MKIPPSQEELNSVHEKMQELKSAFSAAASLSEDLVKFLSDNFLALDDEYKKTLAVEGVRIDSAMWRINVQQQNIKKYKERIVSPESNM